MIIFDTNWNKTPRIIQMYIDHLWPTDLGSLPKSKSDVNQNNSENIHSALFLEKGMTYFAPSYERCLRHFSLK